jgi:hypothetical protein
VRGTHYHKLFPLGLETLMEHGVGRCNQTNLPLIFVHIDVNMFRGWSPVCGTDCVDPGWNSMFPR